MVAWQKVGCGRAGVLAQDRQVWGPELASWASGVSVAAFPRATVTCPIPRGGAEEVHVGVYDGLLDRWRTKPSSQEDMPLKWRKGWPQEAGAAGLPCRRLRKLDSSADEVPWITTLSRSGKITCFLNCFLLSVISFGS